LPTEGGTRGGAAELVAAEESDGSGERPSRVHDSKDALPDDSIPEFEPPPRRE
ncbi:MAG: hypothetical protein QOF55_738, partial [Thermoleophilaceae bacterium]|nr:hypothetical protein [Thermoleophilaceae bacterium]